MAEIEKQVKNAREENFYQGKRGSIFSEFLKDKIEIPEYKKISREELNER